MPLLLCLWQRHRFDGQEKVSFCQYIVIGKAERPDEGHLGCEAIPKTG